MPILATTSAHKPCSLAFRDAFTEPASPQDTHDVEKGNDCEGSAAAARRRDTSEASDEDERASRHLTEEPISYVPIHIEDTPNPEQLSAVQAWVGDDGSLPPNVQALLDNAKKYQPHHFRHHLSLCPDGRRQCTMRTVPNARVDSEDNVVTRSPTQ